MSSLSAGEVGNCITLAVALKTWPLLKLLLWLVLELLDSMGSTVDARLLTALRAKVVIIGGGVGKSVSIPTLAQRPAMATSEVMSL